MTPDLLLIKKMNFFFSGKVCPLILWFGLLAGPCLAQPDRVLVTDMLRIQTVSDVQLSPDGRRVLYTLRSIEPDPDKKDEYAYRSHLWLGGPGQPARPLTFGPEGVGAALWQDANTLLFTRSENGKTQLYRLRLDQGGEARPLLAGWKYGIGSPVLSPDGRRLAFTVGLPLSQALTDTVMNPMKNRPGWAVEKPGFSDFSFLNENKNVKPDPNGSLAEIRAYLQKDEADKKAKVFDRMNFQGEAGTQNDLSMSYLCVADVQADTLRPRVLTPGLTAFAGPEWAAGGKALYAVTRAQPQLHPDRDQTSQVVTIDVQTGRISPVLQRAEARVFAPKPSPDGRWLAVLSSPSEGVNIPKLELLPLLPDGTLGRGFVPDFDRQAGSLKWAADGLYFTAPADGGQPLYRLDPVSRKVEQLSDIQTGITDFDVAAGKLAFARTAVANPSELYWAAASAAKNSKVAFTERITNAIVLTTHNDWVKGKRLSFPEKYSFINDRGQRIDYWVMPPARRQAGKTYPLLLQMHGGPTAMWGPGEASMWHEFQYFCSQGYGIVYANPRGSGGYGLDFQRANIGDWGTGPASDVLRAATEAARYAWVDTTRQVITGGSYAGYLTAWIVAHDHRFKAAFAQRGVYDLTTFMGEGNAWRLVPNYFKYPWLDKQGGLLAANSPYTFVENIRTPLLIKHGENDLRTGVVQSEMMYKSLKVLGRPVEYVRMPGATHELSRSGNVRQRLDRMLRMYEFFERFIGNRK